MGAIGTRSLSAPTPWKKRLTLDMENTRDFFLRDIRVFKFDLRKTSMKNKIRTATLDDAPEILDIYHPYVQDTPYSFETEVPKLGEIKTRMSGILKSFPWLVCELDNGVAGFAYANPYRSRQAYQWTVEASIYVRRGFQRHGLGRSLYEALFDLLKQQGVVNVIAVMTLPNEPSRHLHESFGFTQVAQIKNAGFKFGQWWDIGYWQLELQSPDLPERLQPPTWIVD
jgi:phosphinothricin acetyltransferase